MTTVADAWVAKKKSLLQSNKTDANENENEVDRVDARALGNIVRSAVHEGATNALQQHQRHNATAAAAASEQTMQTMQTNERTATKTETNGTITNTRADVGLWVALTLAALLFLAVLAGVIASACSASAALRQQGEWTRSAILVLQQQMHFQQQQMYLQQQHTHQQMLTLALAFSTRKS